MPEPDAMRSGAGARGWLWEFLAATGVGLLLAVAMTWPAVLHPASTVPGDLGDPLYQTWQLAWGGHALLHHPLHVWDANILYPLHTTLAFSDSLLGYAPLGLVGSGVGAAVVRYNIAYLIACTLAFAGAYVLARQLGCGRWGAVLAGVCFAYAPWRYAHSGHLNILSSGGIPLSLACLVRAHSAPGRHRWAAIGWLVAAWQLTLGFGLGLQFAYLLAVLSLIAALSWLGPRWPPMPREVAISHTVGLVVFLVVGAGLAGPYNSVVKEHPEARRTLADVALFSPPAGGFLTAPAEDRVWGKASAHRRGELVAPAEQAIFPGLTLLLVAVGGLVAGSWPLRRRIGLAVGTVVAAAFTMGTQLSGGRFTYRLLFEHAPGWQGVRTPGRIITLVTLGLCLLAATGVDRLQQLVRRRELAHGVGALLVVLALVEGVNTVANPAVGSEPAAWRTAHGPLLQLPSDYFSDYTAMLWSTDGLPQIGNGTAGFIPRELTTLRAETAGFPDATSVRALRRVGIRTVLLDSTRTPGTPWQDAAAKRIDGLGIQRRQVDSVVVFDLSQP